MFKKVLIANRGEIAIKIIRACHFLGLDTVAVYSKADENSLHVKLAKEAICIGAGPSKQSYLSAYAILSAAELTQADAIHPGYGFLSENAQFAEMVEQSKIAFIGPKVDHIQKMGDKATAKETMKAAGLPTIPGSDHIILSIEEGLKIAKKIGFPILLKATAGGGGKGIRLVKEENTFQKAWQESTQEAKASFNNENLYIEKYIEDPRHIEIQILGDHYNQVCHFSERDCSIQRKHQKLIEEAPSPFLDDNLRKKMGDLAIQGASYLNYRGLGTMEFLVDKHKNCYFMEMNTRVQVEHPVTEQITYVNLIEKQILIAAGEKIQTLQNYFPKYHAIECRINAEDPYQNFRPNPGKITQLHIPNGFGIRVDTHIYENYKIPAYYDSMIAKLIATGKTRKEAIQRMQIALEEFIIKGVQTTIPFHIAVMKNKSFQQGNFTTAFINFFFL